MKKIISLFLTIIITITLSACSSNSTNNSVGTENGNPANIPIDTIYSFVEDEIKSILKKPNSLIVNNISESAETVDDTENYYYQITVDYSAQNGFGGYNRDNTVYYVKADKSTHSISVLSENEYISAVNNALYETKLDSIEAANKIPYSLMCSNSNYSNVASFLRNAGIPFSEREAKSYKELAYLTSIYNLEGEVEIRFDLKNESLYSIEFIKYNDQFFYDGNLGELIYIDKNNIITIDDFEAIRKNICEALGFDGVDKEETSLSNYDSYSCTWTLKNDLSVKIKWDITKENNDVTYFSLSVKNGNS